MPHHHTIYVNNVILVNNTIYVNNVVLMNNTIYVNSTVYVNSVEYTFMLFLRFSTVSSLKMSFVLLSGFSLVVKWPKYPRNT